MNFCGSSDCQPDKRGITHFGQSDSNAAVGDVVRRLDQPGVNRIGNETLQRTLFVEVHAADQPCGCFDQHDRVVFVLESGGGDMIEVIDDPYDSQYGCRIDVSFECLIVETDVAAGDRDRKSTRLNSSHSQISYAVFCLK